MKLGSLLLPGRCQTTSRETSRSRHSLRRVRVRSSKTVRQNRKESSVDGRAQTSSREVPLVLFRFPGNRPRRCQTSSREVPSRMSPQAIAFRHPSRETSRSRQRSDASAHAPPNRSDRTERNRASSDALKRAPGKCPSFSFASREVHACKRAPGKMNFVLSLPGRGPDAAKRPPMTSAFRHPGIPRGVAPRSDASAPAPSKRTERKESRAHSLPGNCPSPKRAPGNCDRSSQ